MYWIYSGSCNLTVAVYERLNVLNLLSVIQVLA